MSDPPNTVNGHEDEGQRFRGPAWPWLLISTITMCVGTLLQLGEMLGYSLTDGAFIFGSVARVFPWLIGTGWLATALLLVVSSRSHKGAMGKRARRSIRSFLMIWLGTTGVGAACLFLAVRHFRRVDYFHQEFNAYIQQIGPTSPEQARERAVRWNISIESFEKMKELAAPTSDAARPLRSIRLGVWYLGLANRLDELLVDDRGFCRLNGVPGRFDVVAFEELARAEGILKPDIQSYLITAILENKTGKVATLIDVTGVRRLQVPAGGRGSCVGWQCDYKVLIEEVPIARLSVLPDEVLEAWRRHIAAVEYYAPQEFIVRRHIIRGMATLDDYDRSEADKSPAARVIEWTISPMP